MLLIPSLLLNVALLLSTVYFLDQLEGFYQQALHPGLVIQARARAPAQHAPRLALHEAPAGGGDLTEPTAIQR